MKMEKVPTVTAQERRVRAVKGKPVFYDSPRIKSAKALLVAHLKQHRPPKPYDSGVRLRVSRLFPKGRHKDGEYRITKPKKASSPISGIKTTSLPVKNTENHTFKGKFGVEKSGESGIMKERGMANGMRTSPYHILTESEIETLNKDIKAIGADKSIFKFNKGTRTGYDDITDEIFVKGDVLPDLNSTHPRDLMSSRAALAHEYYGHRANRGTKLPKGAWNDEFRASYMAAKNCPNLTDEDRRYLILDALERAKEKGVTKQHNEFIRKTLYG